MKVGFVKHYTASRSQEWTTPKDFFDVLHARFQFTLDGACSEENKLLPRGSTLDEPLFWSDERVFCNPPWSDIPYFIEMAAIAEFACLLVPARCNSKWFHRALDLGARVEFFQGRMKFGGGNGSAPFDCCLLLFGDCDAK